MTFRFENWNYHLFKRTVDLGRRVAVEREEEVVQNWKNLNLFESGESRLERVEVHGSSSRMWFEVVVVVVVSGGDELNYKAALSSTPKFSIT